MNYYPHHIKAFNSATMHLTRLERSIYRELLDMYYDTEQPLTNDLDKLCRKLQARSDDERDAVQAILAEFFEPTESGWRQERCEREIAAYHEGADEREAKREHEAERLRRFRDDRRRMFADLRDAAVVPRWDISMSDLRKLHAATMAKNAGEEQKQDGNGPATRTITTIVNQNQNQNQRLTTKKEDATHLPKKAADAAPLAAPAHEQPTDPAADVYTKDIFEEFFGEAATAIDARNAEAAQAEETAETLPATVPALQTAPPKPPKRARNAPPSLADITLPDWLPRASWAAWDAHRMTKPKNAKWTESIALACIAELDALRKEGNDPARVINKSIANGYPGLFPVDGSRHQVRVVPEINPDAGMPPNLSPLEQRNWRNMQIALAQEDSNLRTINPEEYA